jgi:hypothetical protein
MSLLQRLPRMAATKPRRITSDNTNNYLPIDMVGQAETATLNYLEVGSN